MRQQVSGGYKPVEPGVTGPEKLFQENRNFGPGPISPHPHPPVSAPPPIKGNTPNLRGKGRAGNGVFYGRLPQARRV